MKLSICSLLLMLISLFVLQSPKLLASEYSIEERPTLIGSHPSDKHFEPTSGGEYNYAGQHYGRGFDSRLSDYDQNRHTQQQQQQPIHNHQYYEQQVHQYYPESSKPNLDHINRPPPEQNQQHQNTPQQHQSQRQHIHHQYEQYQHQQVQPAEVPQLHHQKPEVQTQVETLVSMQAKQIAATNDAQVSVLHHQQQLTIQQQHKQPRVVVENLHQQEVLIDDAKHGYRYAHTDIRWRHESTQSGELSEFFMANIESSYPMMMTQGQLEYYQYHHELHEHHQVNQPHKIQQLHSQKHIMFSRQSSDEHDIERAQQYYYNHRGLPTTSCESIDNPSMLMMPIYTGEPTCRATSVSDIGNEPLTDSSRDVPSFSPYSTKPSHNSNVESYPIAPPHYHYESSLMAAIRHYWREVSGLCLASAIFLNWLFVVVKRKFISSGLTRAEQAIESLQRTSGSSITASTSSSSTTATNTTSKLLTKDTNSSAHDSAFEENVSPVSLNESDSSSQSLSNQKDKSTFSLGATSETPVMRQRSSTLKAEPIPIPSSTSGHNSLSNSLSNNSEYNSRYSSDFDSIRRLGRGGFGIVFEAKNKIDDCHYAVKRICLPLEKEARERVMREVRALAKLDHAGIVRYYNAWLETPPDDWLKEHDASLGINHTKDDINFASTDGIYDKNESENITKGYGDDAVSDVGNDNSTNIFNVRSPFKGRVNGYTNKYLRENSSSPSLDIVFEGSGSIRVEAENNSEETDFKRVKTRQQNQKSSRVPFGKSNNKTNGDNNDSDSDGSDGSDFIQFESKGGKGKSSNGIVNDHGDNDKDWSISNHLTDPFSSSESEIDESSQGDDDGNQNIDGGIFKLDEGRKNALIQQKEVRRLNNVSMVENLHSEKVYLYIQMQLCRKDTLKDWLRTNCETRDKTTVFDLFYQIVDAVEYVHSQDLIHRDLKPSNIFFSLDGTLKIGDFGLCRAKTNAGVGSSLDLQEYVAESDVERGFEAVHTEQVGTQLYMSPEQLGGLSYNQKVDIFAMGLILLELLVPFKTQMQRVNVLFKARNNLYSDEFKLEHPKEHELVKSLLNRCPHKRPTSTEIKQHELLASAQLSQPVIERIYHRRRTISSNSSTE